MSGVEKLLYTKCAFSDDAAVYAVGANSTNFRVYSTVPSHSGGGSTSGVTVDLRHAEALLQEQRQAAHGGGHVLSGGLFQHTVTSHERAAALASSRGVSLTALRVVTIDDGAGEGDNVVFERYYIVLAGFSNGVVLATRSDGTVLYTSLASDASSAITALATTKVLLSSSGLDQAAHIGFALCRNRTLQAFDLLTGRRVVHNIPVPANTTTVAVKAGEHGRSHLVYVLLCGITITLTSLDLRHAVDLEGRQTVRLTPLLAVGGGGGAPATEACLVGADFPDSPVTTMVALTAAASEGIVRVWDLSYSHGAPGGARAAAVPSSGSAEGRCRRLLSVGHRIARLSVLAETKSPNFVPAVVAVTTITGNVLLWDFTQASGNQVMGGLLHQRSDPIPQPAKLAISSTITPLHTRIQAFDLNHTKAQTATGPTVSTGHILQAALMGELCNGSLVIVRGKYATPRFTSLRNVPLLLRTSSSALLGASAAAQAPGEAPVEGFGSTPLAQLYLLSEGGASLQSDSKGSANPTLAGNSNLSVSRLEHNVDAALLNLRSAREERADDEPELDEEEQAILHAGEAEGIATERALRALGVISSSWATHAADAHRALVTAADEHPRPRAHHASSVGELPVVDNMAAAAAGSLAALYQALHAGDKSLVLELLHTNSIGSNEDASTNNVIIRKLKLPYLLQLLSILAERLFAVPQASHPLHRWIGLILKVRGGELMELEKEMKDCTRGDASNNGSNPSAFLRPLLQRYQQLLSIRSRIALFKGRLARLAELAQSGGRADARFENKDSSLLCGAVGTNISAFPIRFLEVARKKSSRKVEVGTESLLPMRNGLIYPIEAGSVAERKATAAEKARARRAAAREARRAAIARQEREAAAARRGGLGRRAPGEAIDDDDAEFEGMDDDAVLEALEGMDLDEEDDEAPRGKSSLLVEDSDEEGSESEAEADSILGSDEEAADAAWEEDDEEEEAEHGEEEEEEGDAEGDSSSDHSFEEDGEEGDDDEIDIDEGGEDDSDYEADADQERKPARGYGRQRTD